MKVLDSWIVYPQGKPQLLVYCGDGNYMITSNGGFGQRDMYWEPIHEEEALSYIPEALKTRTNHD